jgi:hypothetical protein
MLNVHSRQQVQMHSASNNELVVIKLMVNPHYTKKKISFKFEIQIVGLKKKCEQPKK